MYFMEAALGQFGQVGPGIPASSLLQESLPPASSRNLSPASFTLQVGPLAIWMEMLPCALGVGVAMMVVSMIVAIYYNVIMAYCLHYLFNSLR